MVVHWTGVGVVAADDHGRAGRRGEAVFGHAILVWDNYPVNDYIAGRLLLGPYTGREPGLAEHVVGVISNPMNQARGQQARIVHLRRLLVEPDGLRPPRGVPRLRPRTSAAGTFPRPAKWLRSSPRTTTPPSSTPTESPTLTRLIAAFRKAYERTAASTEAAAG